VPLGHVRFFVDGKSQKAIKLDASGGATWKTASLKPGLHYLTGKYIPANTFFTSSSVAVVHQVAKEHHKGKGRSVASQHTDAVYGRYGR